MTTGKPTASQESTQTEQHHVLEDDQNGGSVRDDRQTQTQKLVRRMRLQIWAGTISGFIIALAIGAAFIAVVSWAEWKERHATDSLVLHETSRPLVANRGDLGRCILARRRHHDLHYGHRVPQDGPSARQMASQAIGCIRQVSQRNA